MYRFHSHHFYENHLVTSLAQKVEDMNSSSKFSVPYSAKPSILFAFSKVMLSCHFCSMCLNKTIILNTSKISRREKCKAQVFIVQHLSRIEAFKYPGFLLFEIVRSVGFTFSPDRQQLNKGNFGLCFLGKEIQLFKGTVQSVSQERIA